MLVRFLLLVAIMCDECNRMFRYVNFLMDEGHDRVKATYGENYDRLRKIKKKYDPDNFFHINQNIKPA